MADAFVFPSRWEAFGIALAETADIGIPTIASDQFNTAAEMARVMTDEALRRSLSESVRQWVGEICSHQRAGAHFEEFYQSVLLNLRTETHCA